MKSRGEALQMPSPVGRRSPSPSAPCRLLRLPPELIHSVLRHLDPASRARLPLISRRFFATFAPFAASSFTELRLVLEDEACRPSPDLETSDSSAYRLVLPVCQCPEHLGRTARFLRAFLGVFGRHLKGVIVEDFLLAPENLLSPLTLGAVLDACVGLESLELHDVDLSGLPKSSLARLGEFRAVRSLALVHCLPRFDARLSDRMLARILGKGIQQLLLKGCDAVSDGALAHLARHCPQLWLADFGGCGAVTARGVAEFAFALPWRVPDLLSLRVEGTSVEAQELQNWLDADSAPRRWECKALHPPPGCPPAVAVSNPTLANKAILLSI